ncbi:MAG: hypothetical protein GX957_02715 [Clostridiaceae bacterium]|nr:hypothetical protein [Clostridiaceae bacterium]
MIVRSPTGFIFADSVDAVDTDFPAGWRMSFQEKSFPLTGGIVCVMFSSPEKMEILILSKIYEYDIGKGG